MIYLDRPYQEQIKLPCTPDYKAGSRRCGRWSDHPLLATLECDAAILTLGHDLFYKLPHQPVCRAIYYETFLKFYRLKRQPRILYAIYNRKYILPVPLCIPLVP